MDFHINAERRRTAMYVVGCQNEATSAVDITTDTAPTPNAEELRFRNLYNLKREREAYPLFQQERCHLSLRSDNAVSGRLR
jgi:hypothetical protein